MSRKHDPGKDHIDRAARKAARKAAWEPKNASKRASWKAQVLAELAEQVNAPEVSRGR